MMRLWCSSK